MPPAQKMPTIIPCVNRTMVVMDIMHLCPAAADIMGAYGLHCFSCAVGGTETLEDGCAIHGFDDETIDALVDDLNEAIRSEPLKPQELTLTEEAAKTLQQIAKDE